MEQLTPYISYIRCLLVGVLIGIGFSEILITLITKDVEDDR